MTIHYIARGKFFNSIVKIEEVKPNNQLLVSINYGLRTLIVPKEFLVTDDVHEEYRKESYNICRYLAKLCYEKFNIHSLHGLSLKSLFLLINYEYYKVYNKQLFKDEFLYEKYKLGRYNKYFSEAVRMSQGYGHIVETFDQDNHIPLNLSDEQKTFISNVLEDLITRFPNLKWDALYDFPWGNSRCLYKRLL